MVHGVAAGPAAALAVAAWGRAGGPRGDSASPVMDTRVPPPAAPSGPRRRDRHGRGMRGPIAPPQVPLAASRAEAFADLVQDSVERLERRPPPAPPRRMLPPLAPPLGAAPVSSQDRAGTPP